MGAPRPASPQAGRKVCQHRGVHNNGNAPEKWRWEAHPPFGAPGAPPSPEEAAERRRRAERREQFRLGSEPSPAYGRVPAWGLPRPEPTAEEDAPQSPGAVLGVRLFVFNTACRWLLIAGIVAAIAGVVRYGLLVAFRGVAVSWWWETLTSALVQFLFIVVFAVALATLVSGVRALLAIREYAYHRSRGGIAAANAERFDPRRRWVMVLSAVIPGVNLLYLPVLLSEVAPALRRADPRTRSRLWIAWAILLVNQVLGVLYWSQVLRPGTQAAANSLFLAAALAACAAVFAWAMRRALKTAEGREGIRRLTFVEAA